jgi:two-component system, LytTR family, response regulator LytT
MRILIIEDEATIAQRLERLTREALGSRITRLQHCLTLASGRSFLAENPIDLLLLDLNLNGKEGFEILQDLSAGAFQTIVVSAYTDKAIEAFEYGVLDFVPKPFTLERLQKAFERYDGLTEKKHTRFLAVKKGHNLYLIEIADLLLIKGAGNYAELHTSEGKTWLHEKNLNQLALLLPTHFVRIHRSYVINRLFLEKMVDHGAGKYRAIMQGGFEIPVSRVAYRALRTAE